VYRTRFRLGTLGVATERKIGPGARADSCQLAKPSGDLLLDVQRKVLTPNDFPNLDTLAERLLNFQHYWESAAKPFEWKFSRQDLSQLLNKLNTPTAKIG
jgi:hypothetical protein